MFQANEGYRKLKIVPWFNKNEWLEVYHEAYSEKINLEEKAYTQMSIWKARQPNLPLGVECTMGMLHVRLCDRQSNEDGLGSTTGTYKENDLQLLYSTAVMRFLNHVTVMSNHKDSMYKMAEQYQIPDWLINLRHEVAHGNSVPALYLLQQAGHIILQWLKVNYWEVEAELMTDFVKEIPVQEIENHTIQIKKLLESWLGFKVHYWAGCNTFDNISDENVRKLGMELSEEGSGMKRKRKTIKYPNKKIINNDQDDGVLSEDENTDDYNHKIKTTFRPLLRRLFGPLNDKKHKKKLYHGCLIEALLSFEGFCPHLNMHKLIDSDVEGIMCLLWDLWRELLVNLQSHQLLFDLLQALASSVNQLTSAHLWLALVSRLLAGHPPPHPQSPLSETVCQYLAESMPCSVESKVFLSRSKFLFSKEQRASFLKKASPREADILQLFAQRVLENPTQSTSRYLNSLLDFWDAPLSQDSKEKLCTLASIYNGQWTRKQRLTEVHTLAQLKERFLDSSHTGNSINTSQEIENKVSSTWELYSGEGDWSKCPLGAVPWQC